MSENNDNNSIFSEFVNQYSVSKTLRFGLEPVGETGEMVREGKNPLKKILEEDEQKAIDYKKAKKIIDTFHQSFISDSLNDLEFSIKDLKEYQSILEDIKKIKDDITELRRKVNKNSIQGEDKKKKEEKLKQLKNKKDKLEDDISNLQDKLRKEVFNCFVKKTEEDEYKITKKSKGKETKEAIFSIKDNKELKAKSELIKNYIPSWLEKLDDDTKSKIEEKLKEIDREYPDTNNKNYLNLRKKAIEIIEEFKKWTSYFDGFNENRTNIYISEKIASSISFRIVHDNLPKFLANLKRYKNAKEQKVNFDELNWIFEKEEIKTININDEKITSLDQIFNLSFFNCCLTQESIDLYQLVLGGKKDKKSYEGENQLKGINQIINEAIQNSNDNEKRKNALKKCRLEKLFKQILGESENSFSFKFKNFYKDSELIEEISKFGTEQDNLLQQISIKDKEDKEIEIFNLKKEIKNNLENLKDSDLSQVWLKNDSDLFSTISRFIFDDSSVINQAITLKAEEEFSANKKGEILKTTEDKRKKFIEKTLYFSLEELHLMIENYCEEKKIKASPIINDEGKRNENKEDYKKDFFLKYFLKTQIEVKENIEKDDEEKNKEKEEIIKTVNIFDYIQEQFTEIPQIIEDYKNKNGQELKNKKGDGQEVDKIKNYLDSLNSLYHFLKPFEVIFKGKQEEKQSDSFDKDTTFYSDDFDKIIEILKGVNSLYNQTRNYLTKKEFSEDKFKLNFNYLEFAKSWDSGKRKSSGCVLLCRKNKYFLAIMTSNDIILETTNNEESCYKKISYKQIADASKDIQNLMVVNDETQRKTGSKKKDDKGISIKLSNFKNKDDITEEQLIYYSNFDNPILEYEKDKYLPNNINIIRKNKSYLKNNENFDRNDLIEFINYYRKRLDYFNFDFDLKETEEYTDFNDFTSHISTQGYKISFSENINEDSLNKLIKDRKVYLFQIYTKDFSIDKKIKGTDNLHTLYWKALFEKNTSIKLNGEAKIFFREKSIKDKDKFIHELGTILKHKRHKEYWEEIGLPIDKKSHKKEDLEKLENKNITYKKSKYTEHELIEYEFENEKKEKEKKIIGKIIKNKEQEITKDKRYTEDKFLLHLSTTINYAPEKKGIKINENKYEKKLDTAVNKILWNRINNNQPIRIIGIDRGERHLAYYSLIDENGTIIKENSLNIIENKNEQTGEIYKTDYHKLLEDKEKERTQARKSWKIIEGIKNLKEGYISHVVHKIIKLAIKNNAIIIFEDLNPKFKRHRIKFEKQIYQKLEKALIDKLNYYVDKNEKDNGKAGHYLKGLQLTREIDTFKKLTNQTGIVYYVNPAYTSKICPLTGFVNLIDTKYKSIKETKELIEKFSKICWNDDKKYFEFHIDDYSKFNTKAKGNKKDWIICTYGERLENQQDKKTKKWTTKKEPINITEELKILMNKHSIDFDYKECLKDDLSKVNDSSFFENFMRILKLTLQMRNSRINEQEDWMISPVYKVYNNERRFFNSNDKKENEPKDADANGAYHIALKGLCLIKKIGDSGSLDYYISNEEWFNFRQNN